MGVCTGLVVFSSFSTPPQRTAVPNALRIKLLINPSCKRTATSGVRGLHGEVLQADGLHGAARSPPASGMNGRHGHRARCKPALPPRHRATRPLLPPVTPAFGEGEGDTGRNPPAVAAMVEPRAMPTSAGWRWSMGEAAGVGSSPPPPPALGAARPTPWGHPDPSCPLRPHHQPPALG